MGAQAFRFLTPLYYGEEAAKHKEEIHRSLMDMMPYPRLYYITLAANGVDQLDILSSRFVWQKHMQTQLPPVVGVAFGRQEALAVLEQMAGEAYAQTGACDFRSFLRTRSVHTGPLNREKQG